MKVAVCLSGHLRTYDKCIHSLMSHIVYPLKADTFIHTWGYIGNPYSTKGSIDHRHMRALTDVDKSKVIKLYKPKKIIIEPGTVSPMPEKDKQFLNQFTGPMYDMFYSIKKSNDLKIEYENENHFKYDVVIRARFDQKFNRSLDLKKLDITHNNIFVPNFGSWFQEGINDQFAVGSSYAIDVYSTYYDNVVNLFEYLGKSCAVEEALKMHLNNNNIIINKFEFSYDLLRLNGSTQWQPKG